MGFALGEVLVGEWSRYTATWNTRLLLDQRCPRSRFRQVQDTGWRRGGEAFAVKMLRPYNVDLLAGANQQVILNAKSKEIRIFSWLILGELRCKMV